MDMYLKLILDIKESPQTYFGEKPSIENLLAYLDGYTKHTMETNGETSNVFDGFQQFIQKENEIDRYYHWAKILQLSCLSSSSVLDSFYQSFEKFLEIKDNEVISETKLVCEDSRKIHLYSKTITEDASLSWSIPEDLSRYLIAPLNFKDTYLKLVLDIKERWYLYFGEKPSLKRLRSYLDGYMYRVHEIGATLSNVFDGFQEFVQSEYGVTKYYDWLRIIQLSSLDNAEVFDNFYLTFEKFLEKKSNGEISGNLKDKDLVRNYLTSTK